MNIESWLVGLVSLGPPYCLTINQTPNSLLPALWNLPTRVS